MSQKSLSSPAATKKSKRSAPNPAANARRRKVQAQKAKTQGAQRRVVEKRPIHQVVKTETQKLESKVNLTPPEMVAPPTSSSNSVPETVAPQKAVSEAPQGKAGPPKMPPTAAPIASQTPAMRQPAIWQPVAPVPVVAPAPVKRWPLWIGGGLLALLLILGGGAFGVYQSWQGSGQIAPNFFIAGQPVGGMTRDQALDTLKSQFGKLDITLVAPDKKWHLPIYNLGGAPDFNRAVNNAYWFGRTGSLWNNVPRLVKAHFEERHLDLGVRWHKDRLKTRMRQIASQYKRSPRNAELQVSDASVQILPEVKGRAMNVGATLWDLQHRYNLHRTTIETKVQGVKPRLITADLEGTDVKIGTFTTRFDSDQIGRTKNLHVASAAVNGKVLMPGETFSFNAATGERTADKGYRMAHIYERKPGKTESEVVDGLAGGTCQVSTTLYNAVRRGNQKVEAAFQIVQREMHSLPVPYIESGLDATVAWPNRDFKFKNTLPHPIYLRASISGSRITMSIWARVPRGNAAQFAQNAREKSRG